MSLIFQENNEVDAVDAVMTNDDVLGDIIPSDQQEALRQFCYQALKLGTGVGIPKASLPFFIFGFIYTHIISLFFGEFLRNPDYGTCLISIFLKMKFEF